MPLWISIWNLIMVLMNVFYSHKLLCSHNLSDDHFSFQNSLEIQTVKIDFSQNRVEMLIDFVSKVIYQ
jgi:hypothetical protein